ncbi:hypothetical protein [Gordonia westfalica]|uniref:Uncharacterized protein n=1 Tax=Gordonia westfalica TaxID=158898 RepID=A0A1H2DQA9_9ACTN|nr:hypothetical protein [Gordonia westfalica]SDT85039.1 hypothetical protein SAMN04488548_11421 [Gordonia westfalica]
MPEETAAAETVDQQDDPTAEVETTDSEPTLSVEDLIAERDKWKSLSRENEKGRKANADKARKYDELLAQKERDEQTWQERPKRPKLPSLQTRSSGNATTSPRRSWKAPMCRGSTRR